MAWESLGALVPILVLFAIGFIAGKLLKTAIKFAVGAILIAVLLSWVGYNVPSISEVYDRTADFLGAEENGIMYSLAGGLPLTAPPFLVGLAIGIWWG